MFDRYAIHFHHPLINYHERDGDPYMHMDEAIAHARMKAGLLVTKSVNKIKILEQTQDEEKGTFRIAFAYAATGKATGGYIEVRPVPKHQQSSATGLQESYAGIALE